MNIAYLMRYWPVYGGGETVTRVLANELVTRIHNGEKNNIYVFYLWDRNDNQNVNLNPNIVAKKIENIPLKENNDIDVTYYNLITSQLEKYIKENSIDILVNQWLPHKSIINAIKKTNTKLVTCHHTMIRCDGGRKSLKAKIFYGIFKDWGALWRAWPILRKPVKESDRFVCLCQPYVDDVKKLYHISKQSNKVLAIENPININTALSEDFINNKEHIVVFVGRIIELKKIDVLIEIWRQLLQSHVDVDWKLVIVGDGPELEKNKNIVKKYGMEDRVIFTGYQNPEEYYRKASIFAMTSSQEGLPMCIIEAQNFGVVPIVMNTSPSYETIISSGENGIIIPAYDISLFIKKLFSLIENDNMRLQMAKAAVVTSKRYDVKEIVNRWENLFLDLLQNN